MEYVPGVCNIGGEEIRYRRNFGWFSLALTVVLFLLMMTTGIGRWWRLTLFLPATMSAYGFIQARSKFCAGFAQRGLFNFGPLGGTSKVEDEEYRSKDRRKGLRITAYSWTVGAAVALVSLLA